MGSNITDNCPFWSNKPPDLLSLKFFFEKKTTTVFIFDLIPSNIHLLFNNLINIANCFDNYYPWSYSKPVYYLCSHDLKHSENGIKKFEYIYGELTYNNNFDDEKLWMHMLCEFVKLTEFPENCFMHFWGIPELETLFVFAHDELDPWLQDSVLSLNRPWITNGKIIVLNNITKSGNNNYLTLENALLQIIAKEYKFNDKILESLKKDLLSPNFKFGLDYVYDQCFFFTEKQIHLFKKNVWLIGRCISEFIDLDINLGSKKKIDENLKCKKNNTLTCLFPVQILLICEANIQYQKYYGKLNFDKNSDHFINVFTDMVISGLTSLLKHEFFSEKQLFDSKVIENNFESNNDNIFSRSMIVNQLKKLNFINSDIEEDNGLLTSIFDFVNEKSMQESKKKQDKILFEDVNQFLGENSDFNGIINSLKTQISNNSNDDVSHYDDYSLNETIDSLENEVSLELIDKNDQEVKRINKEFNELTSELKNTEFSDFLDYYANEFKNHKDDESTYNQKFEDFSLKNCKKKNTESLFHETNYEDDLLLKKFLDDENLCDIENSLPNLLKSIDLDYSETGPSKTLIKQIFEKF